MKGEYARRRDSDLPPDAKSLQERADLLKPLGEILLFVQFALGMGNEVPKGLRRTGDHLLEPWQLGRIIENTLKSGRDLCPG